MITDKFTVKIAKNLHAKMLKAAEDMLDIAAQPNNVAPEAAGSAGPQEVVDALELVIEELEQVSEAIPAEPTNAVPEVEAPVEAPVDPTTEPVADPEEEPRLAKEVKELKAKIEATERESIAEKYAMLHEDVKVQQAKFDEVMKSSDSNSIWTAKIDSIEQYKNNDGASAYKPAKTTTSWLTPRTKVAKLQGSERMNL